MCYPAGFQPWHGDIDCDFIGPGAPEVEGRSKGKVCTPHKFGVKVSIGTALKEEGFAVGARSIHSGYSVPCLRQHSPVAAPAAAFYVLMLVRLAGGLNGKHRMAASSAVAHLWES
ncbi:MAG: hypothetical protein H5U29_00610 [Pusillimonas sp.]|nr:hypothetical protein [Pusillimonas sp.]